MVCVVVVVGGFVLMVMLLLLCYLVDWVGFVVWLFVLLVGGDVVWMYDVGV